MHNTEIEKKKFWKTIIGDIMKFALRWDNIQVGLEREL